MRNIVNVFIHPSIPFVVGAIGHFVTILTHNGSNGVFSQTIGAFWRLDDDNFAFYRNIKFRGETANINVKN